MIRIIKQGLSDSIQDLGRYGFQKYGVVASGAMDTFSHRVANILVGNEENESTLEMTLLGPRLLFEEDALIALCGGDLLPTIEGIAVPMWKPIFIRKNTELKLGGAQIGCRTYLAVAGGFRVPVTMNSQSTYSKAGIGGFKGRTLRSGDVLQIKERQGVSNAIFSTLSPTGTNANFQCADWKIAMDLLPKLANEYEIRIMKGRQFYLFDDYSQSRIFSEQYTVGSQSDRMGYRLSGASLSLITPTELISEAVSFGSIQVPPDGNPILLAADRQTTGGYPKIGQISSSDFTLIAQAKPGDRLSFKEISLEVSQQRYIQRERSLKELKTGIALKFVRS